VLKAVAASYVRSPMSSTGHAVARVVNRGRPPIDCAVGDHWRSRKKVLPAGGRRQ